MRKIKAACEARSIKRSQVMSQPVESSSPGTRRVPQVVVLLDSDARVLSVNRSLAGTAFSQLEPGSNAGLHEQWHGDRDCDRNCRFNQLWEKAWQSLTLTDGIEWEVDDSVTGKVLRINLAKPPAADGVLVDRRRGHALLIVTDITKHRREYESLIRREKALVEMVGERGEGYDSSVKDDNADESYASSGGQLIHAQELERKRIASELHDGIAQSAGVIKYNIEASIERLSRADPTLDLSLLESVVDQTRSLLEEVRRVSANLAPSILDDFGLCVALQWLCDEFRSDTCDYQPSCATRLDEANLPRVIKLAVFRVVQEALNNISKHASASLVKVDVSMNEHVLRLEVADDGIGLPGDDSAGGHGSGLQNMCERVETTGGEFSIESATGKGTLIRASWDAPALDLLSNKPVLDGVDSNC